MVLRHKPDRLNMDMPYPWFEAGSTNSPSKWAADLEERFVLPWNEAIKHRRLGSDEYGKEQEALAGRKQRRSEDGHLRAKRT